MPPEPERIADDIVAAACLLRRMDRTVTCAVAQERLGSQFGAERGKISATVLKRSWKEAGLAQPRGGYRGGPRGGPREDVTELSGGGGLALLGTGQPAGQVRLDDRCPPSGGKGLRPSPHRP